MTRQEDEDRERARLGCCDVYIPPTVPECNYEGIGHVEHRIPAGTKICIVGPGGSLSVLAGVLVRELVLLQEQERPPYQVPGERITVQGELKYGDLGVAGLGTWLDEQRARHQDWGDYFVDLIRQQVALDAKRLSALYFTEQPTVATKHSPKVPFRGFFGNRRRWK